ncbi:MAG: hypothetical protein LQ348_004534 [Seirophora lacunosa]|nr:MAG: hypothetical protein LQ348_004534 [Seirophora lacunosa]
MLVPALLSAGFVLTANAFLLPPEVATTPNNAPKKHLISNLPQSRTITLDCSECPFALASQRNGRHEWTHSVKSDVELTFTTDNDKLKLNGVPVYPVLPPPSVPAPVLVKQIKKSEDDEAMSHQGYEGDLTLSYSIEVHNMKSSSGAQQGITATEITFSILGLDNEVAHVDDIKIKTLSLPNPSTAQDELLIVAVDSKPTDGNSVDAQCATIICRAMHRFRSAVHRVKSHAKTAAYKMKCICIKCMNAMRHAHYHRPSRPLQAGQPTRLPTHNRVRPGHFKPHFHSHGHHHSWAQAFARASRLIFSYALLPIVVGIMFGIATSAIGMLVGQLVVAIWLRLRRTSSKGGAYQRVESEEKEGLPRYEDLEDGTTVTDEKA